MIQEGEGVVFGMEVVFGDDGSILIQVLGAMESFVEHLEGERGEFLLGFM